MSPIGTVTTTVKDPAALAAARRRLGLGELTLGTPPSRLQQRSREQAGSVLG
jgi:hypothetical protein